MKRALLSIVSTLATGAVLSAQVPVWTRQVPAPATSWNDVQMLSAFDGWLAGSGGRLRHTTNGGVSWVEVQVPAQHVQAITFRGPLTGWAVGDGYMRTTDAGASWSHQPTGAPLSAVHFLDGARGWVGAATGQVCRTTDGGVSFSPCVTLPGAAKVHALHFVSPTTGWAACAGGRILRTDDAGQTWVQQASGTVADLTAVEFADASRGWIAAGDRLLRTVDGGQTWMARLLPAGMIARDLDLLGAGDLWVCGEGGRIAQSPDGGDSWTLQLAAGGPRLNAIAMGDLFHGFAAGEQGALWRTSDGSTWQQLEGGGATQGPAVLGMDAHDGQTAWAATASGTILRTTDGGSSWQPAPAGFNTLYRSVAFANALDGYACGEKQGVFPTVAWTHDGGENWSVTTFLMMVRFHDVAALGPQTALVVGETFIWRTSDGGLSWPSVTPLPYATFHAVDFIDASRGWIVGTGLFRTSDGGATWTHLGTPEQTLHGVSFADGSNGWAVGEGGAIARTTDGGLTWTPQSAGSGVPTLRCVQALDAQRLWIGGDGGYLARSFDGGQSWVRQVLPTTVAGAAVWSLAFTAADEGWVGTSDGVWHLGSGNPPCATESYCTGATNSLGLRATLGSTGVPSVAAGGFAVTVGGGVPNVPSVLFLGASGPSSQPFQGGTLCAAPPLVRLPPAVLDNVGSASIPVDLAGLGAAAGDARWLQLWYRDPGSAASSIALSDGLLVRLCP